MLFGQGLEIRWISERHLRVAGPALADAAAVHAAADRVRDAGISGFVDLSPAHSSLLVEFDGLRIDMPSVEHAVRNSLSEPRSEQADPRRTIDIPVCFDDSFAPDLAAVATHSGRSPAAVVEAFVSAVYSVRFLGFLPGFAYLDGLPASLAMPRHASPRARVEPGSVAIAANQAGIYPFASPGGWQIVGRTPQRMFDPRRDPPAMLNAGDLVRFVLISQADFRKIAQEQP